MKIKNKRPDYPLTLIEKKIILPKVKMILKSRIGKNNIISSTKIIRDYFNGGMTTDVQIRHVIRYIRLRKVIKGLVAARDGYFVARNRKEMTTWLRSINKRKKKLEVLIRSIERQRDSLFPKNKKK